MFLTIHKSIYRWLSRYSFDAQAWVPIPNLPALNTGANFLIYENETLLVPSGTSCLGNIWIYHMYGNSPSGMKTYNSTILMNAVNQSHVISALASSQNNLYVGKSKAF